MSYTVLRITEGGVVLCDEHARRFDSAGPDAGLAFRRFASDAAAGLYALTWRVGRLDIQLRTTTSLFDGMPVRYLVSPLAGTVSHVPKTPPPNAYSAVRVPGIATLLTSSDGGEIFESCTAAVVSWDGAALVLPPPDRPRLASAIAAAISRATGVRYGAVRRNSTQPLALVNAVRGPVAPDIPERSPFPQEARELVDAILKESTRRP